MGKSHPKVQEMKAKIPVTQQELEKLQNDFKKQIDEAKAALKKAQDATNELATDEINDLTKKYEDIKEKASFQIDAKKFALNEVKHNYYMEELKETSIEVVSMLLSIKNSIKKIDKAKKKSSTQRKN